jgi:Xaa-Pro aminopeptidase
MGYEFYEFGITEYRKRLKDFREVMEKEDLDAVILTEEENIRWMSGYWVFTMQDGAMNTAVIIPRSRESEPRLLLTSEGTGEELSWIKDIKYWDEGTVSYLEAEKGRILSDSLKEVAGPVKRLGMELSSGMKINLDQDDIDLFRDDIKDMEITDISPDILRLRSIKSDTEIEKLKLASDITCRSIQKGFSEIQEGLTERSLGQKIGKYFFEYGATGIAHIGVGFGELAIKFAHSDPKEYPLEKGVLVKVDAGCSFEGYRCDMYRMACLGKPDREEEKVALTIARANKEIIKRIKNGVSCSSLYDTAEEAFSSSGLSHLLSPSHYIGHGIGLGVHEPPYVYRDSRDILSTGMVLCIEPWTYDPDKPGYSMNIEDLVLVTENGSELLTLMDREIYIV